MRRIEFIAPVEAMRGNLSGKQVLKYAENMNPAWDAPNGKQFAQNYKPRYVGAKRSASGLTYFATKVKSAVNMNEAARRRQAALGTLSALVAALKSEDCTATIGGILWTSPYNTAMKRAYDTRPDANGVLPGQEFDKWAKDKLYQMLAQRADSISVTFTMNPLRPDIITTAVIRNPYFKQATTTSEFWPVIPQSIFNKFIKELYVAEDGVIYIGSQALPVMEDQTFANIITDGTTATTPANFKALFSRMTADSSNKVLWDALQVKAGDAFVYTTDVFVLDYKYTVS